MSVSTKKKYVTQEISELVLPEFPSFVARIVAGRGNNLHEVETSSAERFLVSMPTKFRKNVWVKRGDFVLCEPIAEGDKVKAEISHVLYKEHIKYIKANKLWPKEFDDVETTNLDQGAIDDDMMPTSSDEETESSEEHEEEKTETTRR